MTPRSAILRHLHDALKVASWAEARRWSDGELSAAIDRREVLRRGAALAATVALPGLGCQTRGGGDSAVLNVPPPALNSSVNVAIVGAGLAGLSCAWELLKSGVKVVVYEASPRVGGRVVTEPFGAMFCELGGELIVAGDEHMIALADEFGLEVERLNAAGIGMDRRTYFANGRIYDEKELIRSFRPLAESILKDSRALTFQGELVSPTYDSPVAKRPRVMQLDRMSLAEYLDRQKQVDKWLRDLIAAAYVAEYGREPSDQSALNLILLISPDTSHGLQIYGDDAAATHRIKGGNGRLVTALANAVSAGRPIEYGHALTAVREQATGIQLAFNGPSGTKEVTAEVVVMALPISVLRGVDGIAGLSVKSATKRFIDKLSYGTNAKLALGFTSRPWLDTQNGRPGSHLNAVTTLTSRAIWEASRAQPGSAGILAVTFGGASGEKPPGDPVATALADCEKVQHGLAAAYSGEKRWLQWSNEPWARGSFSCPSPGQYTTLVGGGFGSHLGGRLYLAGEHCAMDHRGRMDGAVESGRTTARQVLRRVRGEITAAK